ncbi:MAG: hypothetical protein JWO91_533 [Acidobacteriaceae bacterium]|nr:hypothetical protein [Acidobacteriaceae bacterium]
MTRAAAFLSAALLAASLGVAQNTSTSGTASRQSTDSINTATVSQSSSVDSGRPDSARAVPAQRESSAPAVEAENTAPSDKVKEDEAKEFSGANPQNATVLPLLGLVGVGSLIAGFFMRR